MGKNLWAVIYGKKGVIPVRKFMNICCCTRRSQGESIHVKTIQFDQVKVPLLILQSLAINPSIAMFSGLKVKIYLQEPSLSFPIAPPNT